jgi:hypothetical protein
MLKTFAYIKPSIDGFIKIDRLRESASDLMTTIDQVCATPSREKSLAVTHLETAIMWAIKSVVVHDPQSEVDSPLVIEEINNPGEWLTGYMSRGHHAPNTFIGAMRSYHESRYGEDENEEVYAAKASLILYSFFTEHINNDEETSFFHVAKEGDDGAFPVTVYSWD